MVEKYEQAVKKYNDESVEVSGGRWEEEGRGREMLWKRQRMKGCMLRCPSPTQHCFKALIHLLVLRPTGTASLSFFQTHILCPPLSSLQSSPLPPSSALSSALCPCSQLEELLATRLSTMDQFVSSSALQGTRAAPLSPSQPSFAGEAAAAGGGGGGVLGDGGAEAGGVDGSPAASLNKAKRWLSARFASVTKPTA